MNIYRRFRFARSKTSVQMNLTLMDLNGKTLMSKAAGFNDRTAQRKIVFEHSGGRVFERSGPEKCRAARRTTIRRTRRFRQTSIISNRLRKCRFSKPNIGIDVAPSPNGFKIKLTTDKVAKAVYLSGFTEGFFVDNYFDLIPGKTVEIEYKTEKKMSVDEFRRKLKVRFIGRCVQLISKC